LRMAGDVPGSARSDSQGAARRVVAPRTVSLETQCPIASRNKRESSELIRVMDFPTSQQPKPSNEILRREIMSASSESKSAKTPPPCKRRQKLQGRGRHGRKCLNCNAHGKGCVRSSANFEIGRTHAAETGDGF
jgi:hypothetical protein